MQGSKLVIVTSSRECDFKYALEAAKKFGIVDEGNENSNCIFEQALDSGLPKQPIIFYDEVKGNPYLTKRISRFSGFKYTKTRADWVKNNRVGDFQGDVYIISIDHVIEVLECSTIFFGPYVSVMNINTGTIIENIQGRSIGVRLNKDFVKYIKEMDTNNNHNIDENVFDGYDTYYVDYLINTQNGQKKVSEWIDTYYTGICLDGLILSTLKKIQNNYDIVKKFDDSMICYPDFPKEGVNFKDMFSSIREYENMSCMLKHLKNLYKHNVIDVVVGLESRGFIIGPLLASKLKVGFVPIRKAGKLPGETVRFAYQKEYGEDVFEVQKSAININTRVLIVDDVLATGGSISAAVQLIRECGGIVVDCCVLKDVPELREQRKKNYNGPITIAF